MNKLSTPEKQAFNQERREVLQQLEDWLEMPILVLGFVWLPLFVTFVDLGFKSSARSDQYSYLANFYSRFHGQIYHSSTSSPIS